MRLNTILYSKLETSNQRICKFYKENPTIDFETVNLLCIDLLEKAAQGGKKEITNQACLSNIDFTPIIKPPVSQDTILSQLMTIKHFYIQTTDSLISTKSLDTTSLESQNQLLMEKLYYLKNELFGETETGAFYEILGNLHSFIMEESSRILKDSAEYSKYVSKLEIFFFKLSNCIPSNSGLKQPIMQSSIQNIPQLLIQTYDTAETLSIEDCVLMRRDNKPSILFKNNEGATNVNTDEISGFLVTTDEHHCHGIFMSQYSGIVSKPNYHIDIHNNQNIIVYIHNVQFTPEKIKMAVDIIDNLESQFKKWNILRGRGAGAEETHTAISKDILDEINKEYQSFISQKLTIIQSLKESQRKVEDMKLTSLETYLATKYVANRTPKLICDLCNIFNACNLKALAAHKRGCKRKICHTNTVEIGVVDTIAT